MEGGGAEDLPRTRVPALVMSVASCASCGHVQLVVFSSGPHRLLTRATAKMRITMTKYKLMRMLSKRPTALSKSRIECSIESCSRCTSLDSLINTTPSRVSQPNIDSHAGHLNLIPCSVAVHVLVENGKCSIGVVPGGEEAFDVLDSEVLGPGAGKRVEQPPRKLPRSLAPRRSSTSV